MTEHGDLDQVSGRTTTGHQWDGIKELNTPLPRWWLITFYLTIVWAVGYWIVYPAWPLLWSHTTGVWNYSTRAEVAVELANRHVHTTAETGWRLGHPHGAHVEPGIVERTAEQELTLLDLELLSVRVVGPVES